MAHYTLSLDELNPVSADADCSVYGHTCRCGGMVVVDVDLLLTDEDDTEGDNGGESVCVCCEQCGLTYQIMLE